MNFAEAVRRKILSDKGKEFSKPKTEPLTPQSSLFLCHCDSSPIKDLGFFEIAPLKNGQWTQFSVFRCGKCGRVRGFPNENFLHALKEGSNEVLDELRKLGVEVDNIRLELDNKNIEELNPSRR